MHDPAMGEVVAERVVLGAADRQLCELLTRFMNDGSLKVAIGYQGTVREAQHSYDDIKIQRPEPLNLQ